MSAVLRLRQLLELLMHQFWWLLLYSGTHGFLGALCSYLALLQSCGNSFSVIVKWQKPFAQRCTGFQSGGFQATLSELSSTAYP